LATLDAERQFLSARRDKQPLSQFESPGDLVSFLSSTDGSLDVKDEIYAALVEVVQDRGRDSDLVLSIAMLGLWPGLDGVYRRNLRFFPSAPDELASEVCDLFTSNVASADLRRISRVAATLVLNVNRDLRRRLRRSWDEARRRAALPDDDLLDTDEVVRGPWASDAPEEASIRAVREWLDAVVGIDRELLERVLIHGEDRKEAGAALGLSHAAARKRYERAIARLSHSHLGGGVPLVKGVRR
jgi:RNA polymerase sigma-70 factor (ECF subfamily)